VGDAQAHLPVGAHGGGHGRRAGRALPAGGPQHGLRIAEDVDVAKTDEANTVVSRHFKIQISDEDDLEKIKVPVVTHDSAASSSTTSS